MEVERRAEHDRIFRVYLPEMGKERSREEPPSRSRRILVVDDEEVVADLLQVALEKMPDFEVVTAQDGESALRLLAAQRFDLLITDYRMPGIDGVSLADRARHLYPWITVIMVTAHDSYKLRQLASGSAVKKILGKPVRLAKIREVVVDALAGVPVRA